MINESGLPPPFKSVVACRPPGISRSPKRTSSAGSAGELYYGIAKAFRRLAGWIPQPCARFFMLSHRLRVNRSPFAAPLELGCENATHW